jgi:hypothetical protein
MKLIFKLLFLALLALPISAVAKSKSTTCVKIVNTSPVVFVMGVVVDGACKIKFNSIKNRSF